MHYGVFAMLFAISNLVEPYKVLVMSPTIGASHSNFLGKIADILVDDGNEVTFLIPVFMGQKKNLTGTKKAQKIIRLPQDPRITEIQEKDKFEDDLRKIVWGSENIDQFALLSKYANFLKSFGYNCEYLFNQTELIEQFRKEQFDLAITETIFICNQAFFDHIGIKNVITAESFLHNDIVKFASGEPALFSFFPDVFSPETDSMSLFGRILNYFSYLFYFFFDYSRHSYEMSAIKHLYENGKDYKELINRAAFHMINSNRFLDYPSATLPKTVFIGGMQVIPNGAANLTKEWDELLSRRDTNILISFGSMTRSSEMPDEFKNAFLDVFSSMPNITFIWKYEDENSTIAAHLPNVKLTAWMPQNDLLADDRLTLFITHGGLGSTIELAHHGKPAIVVPLTGDQPRNAHMLTRHGGAIRLDKSQLGDSRAIGASIATVLNDARYSANARRLSAIVANHRPRDVLLEYCSLAVEFGPLETLNSAGAHLNYLQYHSIDLLIVFLAIFIIFSYVSYRFWKFLICFFIRKCRSKYAPLPIMEKKKE
ncbi:unnamed protein product [Caenorhabditis bovis]|uniref:glucuronosyltransferase n=1 Tax=Caenorhabditis bovis TaxID=2654633 RepID=A0A8S1F304_9PELO|nr:unnamed protein product [Caenorhabditis bovis]